MYTDALPHRVFDQQNMRFIPTVIALATSLLLVASVAHAQPQAAGAQPQNSKPAVITMGLGPDQIGTVKTGERLSTRLYFRETVKEVVCGDLYDPASGTGSFVIQRIERDVFIKPVVPKGISNMFVKTGEGGEHIYNFFLVIVPSEQAYMIVKVVDAPTAINSLKSRNAQSRLKLLPVSTKVDLADNAANQPYGSLADGRLVKLWDYTGMEESPPPPKAAAGPSSLRQREPIKRVMPDYPEMARTANATGDVVVRVEIDKKGRVKSARALSGHLLLRAAAVTASRSWRYTPANDDQPAQSHTTITFRFRDPAEVK
jgi:TonB family protein